MCILLQNDQPNYHSFNCQVLWPVSTFKLKVILCFVYFEQQVYLKPSSLQQWEGEYFRESCILGCNWKWASNAHPSPLHILTFPLLLCLSIWPLYVKKYLVFIGKGRMWHMTIFLLQDEALGARMAKFQAPKVLHSSRKEWQSLTLWFWPECLNHTQGLFSLPLRANGAFTLMF